jgi:hypothetical protein
MPGRGRGGRRGRGGGRFDSENASVSGISPLSSLLSRALDQRLDVADNWACLVCTLVNLHASPTCHACGCDRLGRGEEEVKRQREAELALEATQNEHIHEEFQDFGVRRGRGRGRVRGGGRGRGRGRGRGMGRGKGGSRGGFHGADEGSDLGLGLGGDSFWPEEAERGPRGHMRMQGIQSAHTGVTRPEKFDEAGNVIAMEMCLTVESKCEAYHGPPQPKPHTLPQPRGSSISRADPHTRKRVMCVAEKPAIARAVARALCHDAELPERRGIGTNVHEFSGTFQGKPCEFVVTSVTGHVVSVYDGWSSIA